MYRLRPYVGMNSEYKIYSGLEDIIKKISRELEKLEINVIAIETYPGVENTNLILEIQKELSEFFFINTEDLYISSDDISNKIKEDLTEDEVFGRFSNKKFRDLFSLNKLKNLFEENINQNKLVIYGVGASQIMNYDLLIYLDITRQKIQEQYHNGANNWKVFSEQNFNEKLKRAYYFEWPAGTEIKEEVLFKTNFYIDMNDSQKPKMISGENLHRSLIKISEQPFELVPFFQPGVWGGQWMKEQFSVGEDEKNLAWAFNGVPEENSILIKSKDQEIEIPAQNLIILYPKEILGLKIFGRYGKNFPIRFNYLDTMGGQNLSLQVHPTLDYAYRNFGALYTQDESYYIMDSKDNSVIYLGVKDGVKKERLVEALEKAQETGYFDTEKYINKIPVKKNDHFLIPSGTIHSSGKDCVVLEISSTPNRFTFKLWDWGRLDLDGRPRPISIHHGKHVINTEFNNTFVNNELYNNTTIITQEDNYTEIKTGLHELEPIETRVLTFSKKISQSTMNSVNMMCLVEGDHIQVLSEDDSFNPFDVFYGETFIIPEQVKKYILVPIKLESEVKVVKAYIR